MPHIRLRGLDKAKAQDIAKDLLEEVADATETPISHFTLELVATEFIQSQAPEPFCEILWFDRGQQMQDKVAKIIAGYLKKAAPAKDVVVIFTVLEKAKYYENGKHFG